jgi:hypothetical protein
MSRPNIDPDRERATLLDHPTRRAIARVCRAEPSSVAEIERKLGRKGLYKTVEKLAEWSVLVPRGSTLRGSPKYALDSSWSGELDAALRRISSALVADQRLVLLARPNLSDAAQCLAREHAEDVAWIGVLGAREGLVLGVHDSAGRSPIPEMRETLREAGVDCELKTIGPSAAGDEIAPFLRGFGADDTYPESS